MNGCEYSERGASSRLELKKPFFGGRVLKDGAIAFLFHN
jgi:hypothetical protein